MVERPSQSHHTMQAECALLADSVWELCIERFTGSEKEYWDYWQKGVLEAIVWLRNRYWRGCCVYKKLTSSLK